MKFNKDYDPESDDLYIWQQEPYEYKQSIESAGVLWDINVNNRPVAIEILNYKNGDWELKSPEELADELVDEFIKEIEKILNND